MKAKTSELVGPALDWAVAQLNVIDTIYETRPSDGKMKLYIADVSGAYRTPDYWEPSTNWTQGGPIIEREGISLASPSPIAELWCAFHDMLQPSRRVAGPTPLIAAMRCYVASKLGSEVEIPEELIK